MKVSTRGRYALRLMLDIALNDNGEPIRIKNIASRQGLSDKYLEQIISILHKADYVRSVRGPQGGYLLTREPKEYTVGEILRLTEGSLAPVACLEQPENQCPRLDHCATIKLWEKMNDAVSSVVDTVTLADLMEWQNEKMGYCPV